MCTGTCGSGPMGEQTLSGSIRASIGDYVVCGGTAGYTNLYTKEFVTLDELRARGYTDAEIRSIPLGTLRREGRQRCCR
jgi:hypothetical protein